MKKLLLTLTVLFLILISCNKIDTTHEVFTLIGLVEETTWDPAYAETVIQKIYIEEFTGHFCQFCPNGARELKAILGEDPAVIATAIHCSDQADPGNYPFDKNYKTQMGNQLCKDFNISGLPKATINRLEINPNEWGTGTNKWRGILAAIDRNNVRAGIELQCTTLEEQKEIVAQVSVTIIKELPNPVHVCLILQQDSIISGQLDGSTYILDYEHNHMLRTGFNGNYGTKLTSNGMVTPHIKYSTTFKIAYGNAFPYSLLPVEISHCSVVAYLIDMVTKEVIQVEQFSF